jgi:hypothetical protein
MPKPFKGVVNLDVRDSVPDWEPYLAIYGPEQPAFDGSWQLPDFQVVH